MDGFGVRDALGDPRKFGFVTMEIGAKELAKCEFCSRIFEFRSHSGGTVRITTVSRTCFFIRALPKQV